MNDTVDFELVKSWIHKRETSHDCIGANMSESGQNQASSTVMLMFVIDVKSTCVVAMPFNCRDVTLSSVWGTASMLKHLATISGLLLTPG